MPNPDLIPEPFAQSGDKNPIPLERAISDPIYRASWKAGFPPDTRLPKDLGGEAPDGLDFNGVLNILSQAVVFLQKGNAYQFDLSLAPYPIGALVRSNNNLTTYQSTIPNNSNNPNSNMTGWRVYNSSSFVVDNLTTNDGTKALSAKQGKALQDGKFNKTGGDVSGSISVDGVINGKSYIDLGSGQSVDANRGITFYSTGNNVKGAIQSNTQGVMRFINANSYTFDGPVTIQPATTAQQGMVQLNNTLTSSSTSLALTAAQGKILNDKMFGVGQSWQDVASSRATNTTYTNNTGKPIQIFICADVNVGTFVIDGVSLQIRDLESYTFINLVIPSGSTYRLNTTVPNAIVSWAELR